MHTRQAVLTAPKRFELREAELTPGQGQLLLKVAVCGLCNWEQNHWIGQLGTCPQTLGHEWAGTVAEIGAGVSGFAVGDRVTGMPDSLSGFADYLVVGAANCFKLAPEIETAHALGEPLKCVVTVMRAAAPEAGDVGVVLGCGPMGLWCLQGLAGKLLGALIAVDVSPAKLELARRSGATCLINPKAEDAVARIREISGGRMADFVIEGTGIPELMGEAANYLKTGRGRLVLMSSHERAAREFDWRTVQNKGIAVAGAHPSYSLDQTDDMRRAVRLLNNGAFRMDGIISHRFPLDRIQEGFETLERKPADYIKGVVIP
jgi:threonine dehydrogenase-like Zn-dependent dehydrogenase